MAMACQTCRHGKTYFIYPTGMSDLGAPEADRRPLLPPPPRWTSPSALPLGEAGLWRARRWLALRIWPLQSAYRFTTELVAVSHGGKSSDGVNDKKKQDATAVACT